MKAKLIATLTTLALASFLSTPLLIAEAGTSAPAQQEADSCSAYPEFQCDPAPQELEQEQQHKEAKKLKKQMKKDAKHQAQKAKQHKSSRESGY